MDPRICHALCPERYIPAQYTLMHNSVIRYEAPFPFGVASRTVEFLADSRGESMSVCRSIAAKWLRKSIGGPQSIAAATLLVILVTGCGSHSGRLGASSSLPTGSDSTTVVVLATSTANDRLSQFQMQFTDISLTSQAGNTVSILSSPVYPELLHLNGIVEPLASAVIPRGTYTSATVALGSALFVCTSFDPINGLQTSTFVYGQVPASNINVTLPAPITVSGSAMGILVNLDVAKSAAYSGCQGGTGTSFSITPTFTVAALSIGSPPTSTANGLATGMHGMIDNTPSGTGAFSVSGADGPSLSGPNWQVSTDGGTTFQGIARAAELAQGMPVDMDVAIQPDGSLLATRVSVYDIETVDLNVFTGPMNFVSTAYQSFSLIGQEQQGYLDSASFYSGGEQIDARNATFQIAGPSDRRNGLPFNASFDAATMVAGQNVSVTSHVPIFGSGALPVATVTLMPQTVNGTVRSISSAGGYTTYTVSLAKYDSFPDLASQPGQAMLLRRPGTIIVYAGADTQSMNLNPMAVGSIGRFYGQVFNDQGTLRMDCLQISDGVPE